MSFLNPAFLLGLPLLAVPVAIHLLNRRQQTRIGWGAMRFLRQAATRRRRLWRLTDILLLALRVLALLFFVAALARPLLPASWLHGSVPRDVLFVLDSSLSMSRRLNGASLHERLVEEVQRAMDELTGADSVRVLRAGESPEWLTTAPVPGKSAGLRELKAKVAALGPTLGGADLVGSVREAVDLEAPKDKSTRVIQVFTDGQRFGWRLGEEAAWEALRSRIGGSAIPTTVGVQVMGGVEAGPNLAVNRLETPRPWAAVGQAMSFAATVQNHGAQPSAPTLLAWQVDGVAAGVSTVPGLGPGASTTLTFGHPFGGAGQHEVGCRLESKDEIAGDDDAACLVDVFDRLPVLVVAERSGGDPADDDTLFIRAALGAASPDGSDSEWRSVFQPRVVTPSEFVTAMRDTGGFRSVIWADGATPTAAARELLETYVRNGGGLWLAPGPRTEPKEFEDAWYRGGAGLAPLRLGTPEGDPADREKFVTVRAASEAHPATALLSDLQRLDLDRARIYRRHVFDVASGKNVSVLLQAQDGTPVVVERKWGRGRVVVQAIPLGISWSTLPLCQAYVALVHEWLWYLGEADLPRRNLALGDVLVEPAPRVGIEATLTLPDASRIELKAEGRSLRFGGTRYPGRYDVEWKSEQGRKVRARFQVPRNPEESGLESVSPADHARWASIPSWHWDRGFRDSGREFGESAPKHPLEGWLLVSLPALLLAEMLLGGWSTRRRHVRVAAVTMGAN